MAELFEVYGGGGFSDITEGAKFKVWLKLENKLPCSMRKLNIKKRDFRVGVSKQFSATWQVSILNLKNHSTLMYKNAGEGTVLIFIFYGESSKQPFTISYPAPNQAQGVYF